MQMSFIFAIQIAPGPPATIFKDGAFVDLHDFLWKYEGEYIRLHSLLEQTREALDGVCALLHNHTSHAPPPFRKVRYILFSLSRD
jgi:hypothetical protein